MGPPPEPAAPPGSPTGADLLVSRLVDRGVEVCFANPGTSEMPFVAAAERHDGFRSVLCLFEGVAAGAADGHGRMTGRPAATLLHVGSGFSNAISQLHNAGKAGTPLLNVVGDHATFHTPNRHHVGAWMGIDELAAAVPTEVYRVDDGGRVVATVDAAVEAASRRVATLIVASDVLWAAGSDQTDQTGDASSSRSTAGPGPDRDAASGRPGGDEAMAEAVAALVSDQPAALLVSGRAARGAALSLAGSIAEATGSRLLVPALNGRIERGRGRVGVQRVPYPIDPALAVYRDIRHVVVIGAPEPYVNFAYPDKPTRLTPDGCHIISLAGVDGDAASVMTDLADRLGVGPAPAATVDPGPSAIGPVAGALDEAKIAAVLAATLPDDAIVVDESITSGRSLFAATAGAAPHDWLQNVGGAIGMAMPVGLGAAVACPDRRVVCLEGDGSAMYSIQALWTMSREELDVTTVLFSNRSYQILHTEAANLGVDRALVAASGLTDLDRPGIDWVPLSTSLGVPAVRVDTAEDLTAALTKSFAEPGPFLIEVPC